MTQRYPSASLYDLGLIYDIAINEREHEVTITHTLTSAFCPFADQIVADIRQAGYVDEVRSVQIVTTFDPPFSMDMVPEETRMMLGWI
jgi:Predicted metal-sulfur cluster biosynthetic enzyme